MWLELAVTFFIAVSMKSRASNWPAFLANSPVNLPIPAPSSTTDFPSYAGSKDKTYVTKYRWWVTKAFTLKSKKKNKGVLIKGTRRNFLASNCYLHKKGNL